MPHALKRTRALYALQTKNRSPHSLHLTMQCCFAVAQKDLQPVSLALIERQQNIDAGGEKPKHHHQNNPGDGGNDGFFTECDPQGKKGKTHIEINKRDDTPGVGQQFSAILPKTLPQDLAWTQERYRGSSLP